MNNPQQPKVLLDNITELADTRKQELQTCLDNLQKSLKKAPKGLLRAQPHKNSFQYYIISERGDTKGKYLPRKEIRKAAAIAQRDYNAAVARIIGRKITALDNLTENYHPEEIDAAFTGLHPGRRALAYASARNPKSSSRKRSIAQAFPSGTNTPPASKAGARSIRISPASTHAPAKKPSGSTSA